MYEVSMCNTPPPLCTYLDRITDTGGQISPALWVLLTLIGRSKHTVLWKR